MSPKRLVNPVNPVRVVKVVKPVNPVKVVKPVNPVKAVKPVRLVPFVIYGQENVKFLIIVCWEKLLIVGPLYCHILKGNLNPKDTIGCGLEHR
jgi:hypothetical protein